MESPYRPLDAGVFRKFFEEGEKHGPELWKSTFAEREQGKLDAYYFLPGVIYCLQQIKNMSENDIGEAIYMAFCLGAYVGKTNKK